MMDPYGNFSYKPVFHDWYVLCCLWDGDNKRFLAATTTSTIIVNNKTIATENADRISGWRLPKTIIQELFSP